MRRWLLPLTLGLATPACKVSPERVPIYRYINALTGDHTIRLGELFPAAGLAAAVDDSTFQLLPGTFGGGGTTEIWAYIRTDTTLRRLEFYYDGSETYSEKVAAYTSSLGEPQPKSAGTDRQLVWEDSLTRFVLHLDSARTKPIWSELVDRNGE